MSSGGLGLYGLGLYGMRFELRLRILLDWREMREESRKGTARTLLKIDFAQQLFELCSSPPGRMVLNREH